MSRNIIFVQYNRSTHSPFSFLSYVIIVSSHFCPGLPSGQFPSRFPTKTVHAFLILPMHATCHALLIQLHLKGFWFYLLTYNVCSPSKVNRSFGGTRPLTFSDYMVLYPRRQNSSQSPLGEPHVPNIGLIIEVIRVFGEEYKS
jgi:hypothetical protein